MKSKIVVEVLREQIQNSLLMLSNFFSTEDSKVTYTLDESDQLFDKLDDGTQEPVYGIMLELDTVVEGKVVNRKLWYRRYKIKGSLNDIKATAFKELADVMCGSFLINATRSDNSTVERLSKVK